MASADEPGHLSELLVAGGIRAAYGVRQIAQAGQPHAIEDHTFAAAAHELGHVWIFTHHPFLQTEEGANRVALQLVDRKTLEEVYAKVWVRVGGRGSIAYLPESE